MRALFWTGLALVALGCGGDDNEGQGTTTSQLGGSCTSPMRCYEISNPPDYDVKSECALIEGTWSSAKCDQSLYARKCTADTSVSVNGGPQQVVTYVYFFAEGFDAVCAGPIEEL